MPIRYYISPVTAGVIKVATHSIKGGVMFSFSGVLNALGSQALVYVNGPNLTAIDADVACVDLLAGLTNTQGNTKALILAYLKGTLKINVPTVTQTTITNNLINAGYSVASLNPTSTLWDTVNIPHASHAPNRSLDNLWVGYNGVS